MLYFFRFSCYYEHIEIAKWLYSLDPINQIDMMKEEADVSIHVRNANQTVGWMLFITMEIE